MKEQDNSLRVRFPWGVEWHYRWNCRRGLVDRLTLGKYRRFAAEWLRWSFRGYANSEIWAVDYAAHRFLLARIRILKKVQHGHPSALESAEEWEKVLDLIIRSLELQVVHDGIASYEPEIYIPDNVTEEEVAAAKEGRRLLFEWWDALWD